MFFSTFKKFLIFILLVFQSNNHLYLSLMKQYHPIILSFIIFFLLGSFTQCSSKHKQSNNTSPTTSNETKTSTPAVANTTPPATKAENSPENEEEQEEDLTLQYTKTNTGIEIPKSDNGITIVNHEGWNESQMDFQQGYCEQMMAKMERIDGPEFCRCFLAKVQYYYEPIYIRDAYDDQQTFNKYCFRHAEQYKAEQEAKGGE